MFSNADQNVREKEPVAVNATPPNLRKGEELGHGIKDAFNYKFNRPDSLSFGEGWGEVKK